MKQSIQNQEKTPKKGKSTLKIVLIFVAVVALLVAGGAVWVFLRAGDSELATAKYITNQIQIVYQEGDCADSVTGDIILPTSEEGVDIVWNSDNTDVISDTGVVTRPAGESVKVTLKAIVTYEENVEEREFVLTVIHNRTNKPEDIVQISYDEIAAKNNGENIFSYAEDGTSITYLSGNFSNVVVENVDDALDAVQSIKSIIGLDNPYEELKTINVNVGEDGTSYFFQQYYAGYPVYGVTLTVRADAEGNTFALRNGIYSTSFFVNMNITPALSQEQAAEAAAALYGEEYEVVAGDKPMVIYVDSKDSEPVLVYTFRVYNAEDIFSCDEVMISALDGSVILQYDMGTYAIIGSGENENGFTERFMISQVNPITGKEMILEYSLYDEERNIAVYNTYSFFPVISFFKNNTWDSTAVSAYTNMIKVYDWYKEVCGRKSYDGAGSQIRLLVNYLGVRDNAFWSNEGNKLLAICKNKDISAPTTAASAVDILGHELSHGIFYSNSPCLGYKDVYYGSIVEGYGDVMGCLIEGDWLIAEDWVPLEDEIKRRDAANPNRLQNPAKIGDAYYLAAIDANNNGSTVAHTNATILSHAAYLMAHPEECSGYINGQEGLDKTRLAKLWYKSMVDYGYNEKSTYETVYDNLKNAAINLGFSEDELAVVMLALSEVGILDQQHKLEIRLINEDGWGIDGVNVAIYDQSGNLVAEVESQNGGQAVTTLKSGTYDIVVTEPVGHYSLNPSIEFTFEDVGGQIEINDMREVFNKEFRLREKIDIPDGEIVEKTKDEVLEELDQKIDEILAKLEEESDGEVSDAVQKLLDSARGLYFIIATDNAYMPDYQSIGKRGYLTKLGFNYFSDIIDTFEQKGEFSHYVTIYMGGHVGNVSEHLEIIDTQLQFLQGKQCTELQDYAMELAGRLVSAFYINRYNAEQTVICYDQYIEQISIDEKELNYFKKLSNYDSCRRGIDRYWNYIEKVPEWNFSNSLK